MAMTISSNYVVRFCVQAFGKLARNYFKIISETGSSSCSMSAANIILFQSQTWLHVK